MTAQAPWIPFFRHCATQAELDAVAEVIRSGWLTTGKVAMEFEKEFGRIVGARHAIAVNSCTSALHLALEGIGIGPGDVVVVPSLTFTATAEAVRYLGADVLIADVDPCTGLLTPEILERTVAGRGDVKAVMPVHFGGRAAAIGGSGGDSISRVAADRGIAVIEDAAHAFPAREQGRPVGSLGTATCFSFYANKTLTTGEGGMVTTEDDRLAARMRLMRLHGIDRDGWARFTSAPSAWQYDVVAPGFKYNLTDIAAALGLAQLARHRADHERRLQIARRYDEAFRAEPSIDPCPLGPDPEANAWHLYWIRLRAGESARDPFIAALTSAGIGTSVHYRPLHRMTYWRERYSLHASDFPGAEHIWNGCVSLPLYPDLSDADVARIIDAVLAHAGAAVVAS
jgi:dTDP-4-amino-4,6-dideoxygalactose transaminase